MRDQLHIQARPGVALYEKVKAQLARPGNVSKQALELAVQAYEKETKIALQTFPACDAYADHVNECEDCMRVDAQRGRNFRRCLLGRHLIRQANKENDARKLAMEWLAAMAL